MEESVILPPSVRVIVENELQVGESILWMAQPSARRFAFASLPTLLWGIPFTAFAVFWTCGAARFRWPAFSQPWDFFCLWGIPFVVVGLGMLLSPARGAWRARRTAYLITNRRAVVFEGGWSTTIRSYGPAQLKQIHRKQRADGGGDIIFEREAQTGHRGRIVYTDIGFMGLEEVQTPSELLQNLAAGARAPLDMPMTAGGAP
jgi:hypothetical protein